MFIISNKSTTKFLVDREDELVSGFFWSVNAGDATMFSKQAADNYCDFLTIAMGNEDVMVIHQSTALPL